MKRTLIATISLVCLATAASALNIPETTDYPGGASLSNPNVGTLDPGANTVSGSLNGVCNVGDCNPGSPTFGDTADSVLVTVPAGFQITSLTVTTSAVTGPTNFSTSFVLMNSTFGVVQNTPFLSPLNGTTSNLLVSPVTAGIYIINVYGQQALAPGPFSLNWTVTMNLAPTVLLPQDAITNLRNLITNPYSGLVLAQGQVNSYSEKLTNALDSVLAGRNKQAANQLKAFLNSVEAAHKTGRLSDQDANTLIVAANAIIASLQ